MEMRMKYFSAPVKAVDADNRRITVCISKDEIDRHNERIEISAIAEALKGYATNPVVLGDHQHRLATGESSVIGHAPPESFRVLGDEVDVDIIFSTTKNADTYWINYRDRHQKAVSIGFIDIEWRFEEEGGRKIYVSTKIELLELSCVAVGANRGAIIKVAGAFDREADTDITALLSQAIKDAVSELRETVEQELDEIKAMLSDRDGFAEAMLGDASDQSITAEDGIAEQCNRIETLLSKDGD